MNFLLAIFLFEFVIISSVENYSFDFIRRGDSISLNRPEDLFTWAANSSIEPCDNFYQFVCNNTNRGLFSIINTRKNDEIYEMMSRGADEDDPKYVKLLKNYFQSCAFDRNTVHDKLNSMMDMLRKVGKWPLLDGDQWTEADFNWIDTLVKLKKLGFTPDFVIKMTVELHKHSSKILIGLKRPNELYLTFDHFRSLSMIIYQKYGKKMPIEDIDHLIRELVDFREKIANLWNGEPEIPYDLYLNETLTTTFRELSEKYPISIPWVEYVNKFLPHDNYLTEDNLVYVEDMNYLSGIEKIFNKTSKRVQADFFIIMILHQSSNFIFKEYSPMWRRRFVNVESCIEEIFMMKSKYQELESDMFPTVWGGATYAQKYSNRRIKHKVTVIYNSIRDTIIRMLNSSNWMDNETKKKSIEKIYATNAMISFPEELYNNTFLDEFFEGLELNDNYFQNHLNLALFSWRKMYGYINRESNLEPVRWLKYVFITSTRVFNNLETNDIVLPASFLQEPIYSENRPDYINYGTVGTVIGHELFHGLDSQGSQFDKDGFVKNWWSENSRNNYKQKVDCLIKQFNNFTTDNVNVNGFISQGENFADSPGVKAAYLAAKKWVSKNHKKKTKIIYNGKKFTPTQMFWMGFAFSRCEPHLNLAELYKDKNVHLPWNVRVMGSVINTPEFAQDFHCPVGSKMNPTDDKKCLIL